MGSPGSRAKNFFTCPVLRPRRVVGVLAISHSNVLPSHFATASAPGTNTCRGSIAGLLTSLPTLRPLPLRVTTHGSGPMRFATPSSCQTCTNCSLPLFRRPQRKISYVIGSPKFALTPVRKGCSVLPALWIGKRKLADFGLLSPDSGRLLFEGCKTVMDCNVRMPLIMKG
jgi:hypothetical protein